MFIYLLLACFLNPTILSTWDNSFQFHEWQRDKKNKNLDQVNMSVSMQYTMPQAVIYPWENKGRNDLPSSIPFNCRVIFKGLGANLWHRMSTYSLILNFFSPTPSSYPIRGWQFWVLLVLLKLLSKTRMLYFCRFSSHDRHTFLAFIFPWTPCILKWKSWYFSLFIIYIFSIPLFSWGYLCSLVAELPHLLHVKPILF